MTDLSTILKQKKGTGSEQMKVVSFHKSASHPVAIIQLERARKYSMCLQASPPVIDTPCVSFDLHKFPSFSTISKCKQSNDHCYSQNPATDIASGPVFCGNKLDSFFTGDQIIPIHNDQSIIVTAIQILVDHVE